MLARSTSLWLGRMAVPVPKHEMDTHWDFLQDPEASTTAGGHSRRPAVHLQYRSTGWRRVHVGQQAQVRLRLTSEWSAGLGSKGRHATEFHNEDTKRKETVFCYGYRT